MEAWRIYCGSSNSLGLGVQGIGVCGGLGFRAYGLRGLRL